jgi:hypothetical protein
MLYFGEAIPVRFGKFKRKTNIRGKSTLYTWKVAQRPKSSNLILFDPSIAGRARLAGTPDSLEGARLYEKNGLDQQSAPEL